MALFMEKPNGDGWAHLVSDLDDRAGREELRAFLKIIGVRRPLHRAGTYAEHCDIRGTEIPKALEAGARVISWRELAKLLRRKRYREDSRSIAAGLTSSKLIPRP